MAVNNNTRQDVNFIPPFQPNGESIPDNPASYLGSAMKIFQNINNKFLKNMFFIKTYSAEPIAVTTKVKKKKKKKKKKSKAGRNTLCRSPIDKRLISSSSPMNIRTDYSSSPTSTMSMDSFSPADTRSFDFSSSADERSMDSSDFTNPRLFYSSSPIDIKLFNASISKKISDAARISGVLNCPSNKPTIEVAKRVNRWLNSSRADIREFTDRKNGRVNRYYLNYKDTDIDRHRAYHHLSGIERILSNPEIKEEYCMEFLEGKKKRILLNATVSYKDSNNLIARADGQAHVMIGADNVMYHAKFQPNGAPTHLKDDTREDEWTTQGDLVFEINENNTLSMKFPNDRQNIHYTFFQSI